MRRYPTSSARRGFTLLEVMVALAILVVTLIILVETQSGAAAMAKESERVVLATDLAQMKLTEVQLLAEEEGFQVQDVYEEGDFDDFGDDLLDASFREELEDYHWEYWISEMDIGLAGDLMGMVGGLQGSGLKNSSNAPDLDMESLGGAIPGGLEGIGAFLSPEMITQQLAPHLREARVRVWWGDDSEEAEERGTQVELVMHVSNPKAYAQQNGMQPGNAEGSGSTRTRNPTGRGTGDNRPVSRGNNRNPIRDRMNAGMPERLR